MALIEHGGTGRTLPTPALPPSGIDFPLTLTTFSGRKWGLYLRISDDAKKDEKGVARQEADERAWVEQVSGIVEKVYTENDTSAYKKRKVVLPDGTVVWRVVRPLWEEMLKDLRSGVIQGVVVYDLDRLARDPRDLEDAIEIVEHHRRPVVGLTGGFDLLTDSGKFAARILVACANKASADTARRVRRKHVDLQAEGSTGSGPRPFGWADDHATLHPTEAPIVQRVCRQVGEGIPIDAIVRDLNKQGITGTRGKPWRVSTLKPYLRNPRLCGWRGRTVGTVNPQTGETCRHVEIVRDAAGNPVVGQWQPIITPEQWETVVEKIGTRKQPGNGHNARRYLLSGITRCGECGRKMSGMPRPDGRGYAYRCNPQNLGCSKIVRDGIKVDAYVTAALLAKVEMELSQAVAVVDTTWSRETELADTEKEIAELTARFKAKTISSGRYYDLLAHLEGQERELLAERRKHTAAVRATKARPANVRAEWNSDGCPLSWKRAIIEDYIHAVVVNKARYKGARFDPDLLDITWKGEADADVAPEAEAA